MGGCLNKKDDDKQGSKKDKSKLFFNNQLLITLKI